LGKGLKALISIDETEDSKYQGQEIAISQIEPNPFQPRKDFNADELDELSSSIREKGILQPLVVRRKDDRYQLIIGERRLRAAQKAGLSKVPVIIRQMISDRDMLEIGLVENVQRADLNEIEEARGYKDLADNFGYTHEEIAKRLGRSRAAISNALRLLKLSPAVMEMLSKKEISMGHARALLVLKTHSEQEYYAGEIKRKGLSVRSLEKLLSSSPKKAGAGSKKRKSDPHLQSMEKELQYILGTRVQVIPQNKGGKIQIQYLSNQDLNRLFDLLKGEK
jgi:ParB family chromosome partitioning protein